MQKQEERKGKMQNRIQESILLFAGGVLMFAGFGCATVRDPAPVVAPPVVERPTADQPPATPPPEEVRRLEEMTGQLTTFGKLRTVIIGKESITDEQGREQETSEIRPLIERELAARDFRLFTGLVQPQTDVARATRETEAHLVVVLEARSEFVNTTGRFSRYRAEADVRAVRARDGSLLGVIRQEHMGPRQQDSTRAGRLALREMAAPLAKELVDGLLAKTDQLQWSGLVVQPVADMDTARRIRQGLEAVAGISYVELLRWDENLRKAYYEVIHSLRYESDLQAALAAIPRLQLETTRWGSGAPETRIFRMHHYK